jgi:hemerythrin-like domain-containing protein
MKRHESLVAISREHHFGLLFCWKIRQGINNGTAPERMQAYLKYFWENHLSPHFEEEETLLFPLLQDALVEQALSEHRRIGQLIASIRPPGCAQPEQMIALADAVDNHIRFEERTLFPHMEKILTAEKLEELGKRLIQTHATPANDNYPDAFWI